VELTDACPACQPGIPDASPALTSEPANGGTLTTHECGSCGTAWATWWCRDGWPVERKLAPMSAEQAGRNRSKLAGAMRRRAA
jgi:hypothetical protein